MVKMDPWFPQERLKQLEVHESTIGVRPSVVRRRERLFISTLSL